MATVVAITTTQKNIRRTKLKLLFNDLLNGFGILVYLIRSHDGVDEMIWLYGPPKPMGDSRNGHDNDGVDGKRSPLPYDLLSRRKSAAHHIVQRSGDKGNVWRLTTPLSSGGGGGEEEDGAIFFFPPVTVHTADKEKDLMETNTQWCTRLREIWDTASKSYEFVRDINNSKEMVPWLASTATEDHC